MLVLVSFGEWWKSGEVDSMEKYWSLMMIFMRVNRHASTDGLGRTELRRSKLAQVTQVVTALVTLVSNT